MKGRSFPFKGIIAYPPWCQGPIYYFFVFAFFSLLRAEGARVYFDFCSLFYVYLCVLFLFFTECSGLDTPLSLAALAGVSPIPLALSRFLQKHKCLCKNRSAAPLTAPCFVRRTRSLFVPPRGEPSYARGQRETLW